MRGYRRSLAAAMLVLAGLAAQPAGAQDEAGELERLRAGIAELERELERRIESRDDGMAELRRLEISLADTRAELAALETEVDTQRERRAELEAAMQAGRERLAGEESALAEQLRLSYMTGRQEFARLLLSQEDPADLGRMLAYYDYLNRHRSEQIAAVDAELERLAALAEENAAVGRELERLAAEQETRLARLEAEQAERRELLARLDAEIEAAGNRIERMRAEEAELAETIARLAEAIEGFPVTSEAPFASLRGELPWPVEGRIAAAFGDKRDEDGLVRWDGVLLEAPAGTPVRAVYHGRVIHAEWVPHMGLLLILEHGDDHWSLYGHNSALLAEPGDWVTAGSVIAEVGNTGGRVESALYFSILEGLEPVDPARWLR